ncbi:uncharacterized protein LOC120208847 [Hibiscus syriacus]|uniref:uncharacterized protein LOC120208847 n=1 Tax=Hibiscus syriacus TaxID=106335 RepID=UPI0019228583|nr:uncharacterized protein LOC120208847 [Hibiscus syriacus]
MIVCPAKARTSICRGLTQTCTRLLTWSTIRWKRYHIIPCRSTILGRKVWVDGHSSDKSKQNTVDFTVFKSKGEETGEHTLAMLKAKKELESPLHNEKLLSVQLKQN